MRRTSKLQRNLVPSAGNVHRISMDICVTTLTKGAKTAVCITAIVACAPQSRMRKNEALEEHVSAVAGLTFAKTVR